ncbi:hypothetical protein DYQ86_22540 [Acidobacteria bacterium AB60]|nr:hypothetical protein DYQ86_22540 [Acidobacteria bacterium AB60]
MQSPFVLNATATECSSQSVTSIGYALDGGTPAPVAGATLSLHVTAAPGAHTLHVQTWGGNGDTCDTKVAITVAALPAPVTPNPGTLASSGPAIPASAVVMTGIQSLNTWQAEHDDASGDGTSTGATGLAATPSQSGMARSFTTSYTNYGGERYHVAFATDPSATNFLYDAWVYVASPSDGIANLEFDMNQVLANGQTVIFGFQCDGYSGTWDYTENAGSPTAYVDRWLHSAAACNPRDWSTDTWHHIQVTYSRDDGGNVNYQSVWFDGTEQEIHATVPSAFALGWNSVLLTNFQVDGVGSAGSSEVYIDNLTVARW